MPDQREAVDAEMVGQRDQVGDRLVGRVILDAFGLGRFGEAALVGREDEMVLGEVGDLVAPGAVQFGKAVEQDDRGVRGIAGDRDIELDAGGQGHTLQLEIGHSAPSCLRPESHESHAP